MSSLPCDMAQAIYDIFHDASVSTTELDKLPGVPYIVPQSLNPDDYCIDYHFQGMNPDGSPASQNVIVTGSIRSFIYAVSQERVREGLVSGINDVIVPKTENDPNETTSVPVGIFGLVSVIPSKETYHHTHILPELLPHDDRRNV